MPFVSRPGLNGKIYVPEHCPGRKKHNCRNCYACQVCSDDRCSLCLDASGQKAGSGQAVLCQDPDAVDGSAGTAT
jgi:hypothetical protein